MPLLQLYNPLSRKLSAVGRSGFSVKPSAWYAWKPPT